MAKTTNELVKEGADPVKPLRDGLDMAMVQHQKFRESRQLLDNIREGMDRLVKLGDMVTPEDVIGEAGKMVGHGVPAPTMAEILAEMPDQGGQGLAAWIKLHDINIQQTEMHLDSQMVVHQHHMAVQGLRVLAGEHLKQSSAPPQGGGVPQTSILQVAAPPQQGE